MLSVVPTEQHVSLPGLPGVPAESSAEEDARCRVVLPPPRGDPIDPYGSAAEKAEKWLLSAEPADVRQVLDVVRAQRPNLFEAFASEDDPQAGCDSPGRAGSESLRRTSPSTERREEEALRQSDALAMAKEKPLVQFSAPVCFCRESEGAMVVDVARLGNQDGCSEVHYTTVDVTAFAGLRYEKVAGKLLFQPGETQKEIRVPVYYTKDWEPTTEFLVRLLEDPPPGGCTLGRYLHKTRVKVIDEGCFPSPRFRQLMEEGMISKVPKWLLLYEYVCLNFKNPVVRRGTIKMVMLDALHTAYFLLQLLMNVYLVDSVIQTKPDEDALYEDPSIPLLALAGLLVVPFGVLHVLDYLRLTWKVGGASRTMLQKALLRKFLNYNEPSRQQLNRGRGKVHSPEDLRRRHLAQA